ncbi:MAG: hypothetical protein GY938_29980 [Ketobacter sp.]|nr:hypothetical protein [Ketobacter sp.]
MSSTTSTKTNQHPIIRAIAYLVISGGSIVLIFSLALLHSTLQKQSWPAATIARVNQSFYYQVGEKRYEIQPSVSINDSTRKVYFNPEQPDQFVVEIPSFWWHLYLSMAGLIVLYAGLHLRQERNRNIQSLGFE